VKPMLAGNADLSKLKYPLWASVKLDGVRAIVKDGVVLSRNLKPIPNKHVQKLFGKRKYNGFDGELILGDPCDPEAYRKTVSAVMSEDGEPEVTFYLFDLWDSPETPYSIRGLVKAMWQDEPQVDTVLNHTIRDEAELLQFEEWAVGQGYEGLMLRDPNGIYKYGRSTTKEGYLLKLKRFSDSEAEIIDFEELMHNQNEATKDNLGHTERSSKQEGLVPGGVLGALHVRDVKTGVEFKIGSGFTEQERKTFWEKRFVLRGTVVKYQYFPTGSKDKPRFPTYLGLRYSIDT